MTFYKFDVQYGVEADWLDLGFYYCCMVWYAECADAGELAHAREGAIRITSELLARNTVIWDLFISTGPPWTVIEHSHPVWPHPVLSGLLGPPELSVFVSLRSGGRQVSYKRVRGPVRMEDLGPDGRLTDWALGYYQSVADLVGTYGCFRNINGELIDSAIVNPRVVDWQLRHGTKRRNYRRLV